MSREIYVMSTRISSKQPLSERESCKMEFVHTVLSENTPIFILTHT